MIGRSDPIVRRELIKPSVQHTLTLRTSIAIGPITHIHRAVRVWDHGIVADRGHLGKGLSIRVRSGTNTTICPANKGRSRVKIAKIIAYGGK